jgi:MFS family permease
MTESKPNSKVNFFILWQGLLISVIGSGFTSFALGVMVYQKTGLATFYGILALMAFLPGVLIKPVAGYLADHYNRRNIILLSELGSGLGILFIALMIWTKHFEFWQVYLGVGFSSLCNGISVPASQAAVAQLVPKSFYGQASGMMQGLVAAQFMISPILASILMVKIGIHLVLLIDVVSFLYVVVSMLFIRIPAPEKTAEGNLAEGKILAQFGIVFKFLRERPGLLMLHVIAFMCNFFAGFFMVLIGPLILSFTTPQELALAETISSIGMIISSILVAVLGAPRRLVKGLFLSMFIMGICFGLIGVRANFYVIVVPCFIFLLNLPIVGTCVETINRKKVVQDMQGRIFALGGMLSQIGMTLSYSIAGPIADKFFEPLFAKGGLLVGSIGKIIGTGRGRGMGLIFIITGIMLAAIAVIGYSLKRIKRLETELPDVC